MNCRKQILNSRFTVFDPFQSSAVTALNVVEVIGVMPLLIADAGTAELRV
jgi:hypothetical protein